MILGGADAAAPTAVEVCFEVAAEERAALLTTIHRVLVTDPHLSPRTLASLSRAYDDGQLAIARIGPSIVGWVICRPLGRDSQELAGAYVVPRWRGTSVVRHILTATLPRARHTVCVTSNPILARYLRAYWGFTSWPVHRLVRLAGLELLRDRVSLSRLRYGRSYVRFAPPRVLVHDRRG